MPSTLLWFKACDTAIFFPKFWNAWRNSNADQSGALVLLVLQLTDNIDCFLSRQPSKFRTIKENRGVSNPPLQPFLQFSDHGIWLLSGKLGIDVILTKCINRHQIAPANKNPSKRPQWKIPVTYLRGRDSTDKNASFKFHVCKQATENQLPNERCGQRPMIFYRAKKLIF